MAAPSYVTGDVPTATEVNNFFVNMNVVVKAADETVSASTALQDDNELSLAVAASTNYIVDMLLQVNGTNVGDIKYQFTGPAGATFFGMCHGLDGTAADGITDRIDVMNLTQSRANGTITGSVVPVRVYGLLKVSSTAGNLTLQWAQNSASGTTTVQANSVLRLTQIS